MNNINPNFNNIGIQDGLPNCTLDNNILKDRVLEIMCSCPEGGVEKSYQQLALELGIRIETIHMTEALLRIIHINEA